MVMDLEQRLHTQVRSTQIEDASTFPEINTGYPQNQHTDFAPLGFRMAQGLLQGSDWFMLRRSGRMEEEPQHGSSQPFYLHAPGLPLVTNAIACITSIWKLLVLPKELRIKTYYSHGLLG
jgi:hypothetical protein